MYARIEFHRIALRQSYIVQVDYCPYNDETSDSRQVTDEYFSVKPGLGVRLYLMTEMSNIL